MRVGLARGVVLLAAVLLNACGASLSHVASQRIEVAERCQALLEPSNNDVGLAETPIAAEDIREGWDKVTGYFVGTAETKHAVADFLLTHGANADEVNAFKASLDKIAFGPAPGSSVRVCSPDELFPMRGAAGRGGLPYRVANEDAVARCLSQRREDLKAISRTLANGRDSLNAAYQVAMSRQSPAWDSVAAFLKDRLDDATTSKLVRFESDAGARVLVRTLEGTTRRFDRQLERWDEHSYGMASIAGSEAFEHAWGKLLLDVVGPWLQRHDVSLVTLARAACSEMRERSVLIDESALAPGLYRQIVLAFNPTGAESGTDAQVAHDYMLQRGRQVEHPNRSIRAGKEVSAQLLARLLEPAASSDHASSTAADLLALGVPPTANESELKQALNPLSGGARSGAAGAPDSGNPPGPLSVTQLEDKMVELERRAKGAARDLDVRLDATGKLLAAAAHDEESRRRATDLRVLCDQLMRQNKSYNILCLSYPDRLVIYLPPFELGISKLNPTMVTRIAGLRTFFKGLNSSFHIELSAAADGEGPYPKATCGGVVVRSPVDEDAAYKFNECLIHERINNLHQEFSRTGSPNGNAALKVCKGGGIPELGGQNSDARRAMVVLAYHGSVEPPQCNQ